MTEATEEPESRLLLEMPLFTADPAAQSVPVAATESGDGAGDPYMPLFVAPEPITEWNTFPKPPEPSCDMCLNSSRGSPGVINPDAASSAGDAG